MICWFSASRKLTPRTKLNLRHTTRDARAVVTDLLYRVDITTMTKEEAPTELKLNDIACVRLRLAKPIFMDSYADNRITGSFVLVDEQTNDTVAAGMIQRSIVHEEYDGVMI